VNSFAFGVRTAPSSWEPRLTMRDIPLASSPPLRERRRLRLARARPDPSGVVRSLRAERASRPISPRHRAHEVGPLPKARTVPRRGSRRSCHEARACRGGRAQGAPGRSLDGDRDDVGLSSALAAQLAFSEDFETVARRSCEQGALSLRLLGQKGLAAPIRSGRSSAEQLHPLPLRHDRRSSVARMQLFAREAAGRSWPCGGHFGA